MSAIAELRAATWHSHQRLEKRLDVKHRFSSLPLYIEHLERMYGFCAGLECRIGHVSLGEALTDLEQRRKLPLLARDLLALGVSRDAISGFRNCQTLPVCDEPAAAFGCLYVLEGATLGGRTLLPVVNARLGLTAEHGAAFLASYGDEVGSMWRSFGLALDAWCMHPARSLLAAEAAVATFDSLEAWLCESGT